MDSNREASRGEFVAFDLICSGCGADVNAPDKEFWMGNLAFPPHADYALSEVRCLTCDMRVDLCLWIVSKEEWLKDLAAEGASPEVLAPDAVAVLDRYLKLVENYRRQWETFYGLDWERGLPEIDFSSLDLDFSGERWPSMRAEVLAAARGMRKAVATRPGEGDAPGMLRVGQFQCILSFDEISDDPMPYALHLSVMNRLTPGMLSAAEEAFLLSLFYVPGERPFLRAQPGQTVPVTHYYLGADSPELNEC